MRNVLIICLFYVAVSARKGFGPSNQEWGYVTVREDAHMFWWLHYTLDSVDNATERPLVIWLQGGPGASSTGYGNFAELGALDTDLNPRNTTWLSHVNVMFVDNPVGTGYSYVENSAYATTNRQIAEDFVELLKGFYKTLPEFETVPLYFFSESYGYGGKMAAEIALVLQDKIRVGDINCNLKGVALGDSWISPIDSVKTWGPYLFNLGVIDRDGLEHVMEYANATEDKINAGKFEDASFAWEEAEMAVKYVSENVDFYNVLRRTAASQVSRGIFAVSNDDNYKIEVLMTGVVKKALNISHEWQSQSDEVFDNLFVDFMKPVTSIVEELLNSTDIQVTVYNGQLDLIVDTLGTITWVEEMNWTDKPLWKSASRKRFSNEGYYEGFVQKSRNFAFYWVDRSGHMVPADNPSAMYYILREVTNDFTV